MSLPREPGEKPRVSRADLHVGVGLGDEHPDLVGRPMGQEDRERRQPRDVAKSRKPGRDPHHVLLRDAHLEEALRVRDGVSVEVDEYSEDWTRLVWVRVDGLAEILTSGAPHDLGIQLLEAKYPQYARMPLGAALRERHASTLDGRREDGHRPLDRRPIARRQAGLDDRLHVVPVDLGDIPSEGRERVA